MWPRPSQPWSPPAAPACPAELLDLAAAELRAVARYHARTAAELRARAARLEKLERIHRRAVLDVDKLKAAPLRELAPWERRRRRKQQRETDVMRLVTRGWKRDEIARRLKVSPRTVTRITAAALGRAPAGGAPYVVRELRGP